MELFGFQINRKKQLKQEPASFSPKENEDGSTVVAAGGVFGTFVDLDGSSRSEAELVTRYRDMAAHPEVDDAIAEIVNDALAMDEHDPVSLVLDAIDDPALDALKEVILEEFEGVLDLFDFRHKGPEIFRKWYVDGRLFYHAIIDHADPVAGIKELRYIDPRKMKRVVELSHSTSTVGNSPSQVGPGGLLHRQTNEYYLYSERGFNASNTLRPYAASTVSVKIASDSIIYLTSGLTDTNSTMVLSYLHKAIRALNELRTLEDATVIYTLARAPSRRVWYVDTGTLSNKKAEQYVQNLMIRHKNKMVYDSCLAMDTRVPLLDGRTLTIEEIAKEKSEGKKLWAYSADPRTGRVVPGLITFAGKTRENAEVVRVHLDSGDSVVCTPDHEFPLWDRGKVRAEDLRPGDSMLPLYRRDKKLVRTEYEQVYDNASRRWEFTHRLVSRWKDEVKLPNTLEFLEESEDSEKRTVHHRNYNRRDNSPENLARMLPRDRIGDSAPAKKRRERREPASSVLNHKVAWVERLEKRIDVGTLGIDQDEVYHGHHNFALDVEIFTQNSTGEIRDDRKFMCLDLATRVPLLDGRTLTLSEIIAEHRGGKQNWVYSCDPVTGKFSPGPVSWAGVTQEDAEVVRVTLDSGESIVCTPSHRFPVWGEGLVEARHLAGKSIVPGYRRRTKIVPRGNDYEQFYANETSSWEYTHREVAKWMRSEEISSEFTFKDSAEKKTVVHHLDYDRFNNSPGNLAWMGYKDHLDYHVLTQNIDYTEEMRALVEECASEFTSVGEVIGRVNERADLDAWRSLNAGKDVKLRDCETMSFNYKDLLRITKSRGFKDWREYRRVCDSRERRADGRLLEAPVLKGSAEHYEKLSISARSRKHVPCKTWRIRSPDGEVSIVENLTAYCSSRGLNRSNIKGRFGSRGYHAEQLKNHRCASVEYLEERMSVGCLSVDADEKYHGNHTYLLEAGVYTENSMLEDYWLPRREGGRGTQVDTIEGSATFANMDGVNYFLKKLYRSLNVPVERLESEESVFPGNQTSQITKSELKFYKFISILRNKFSKLFLEALERQLILKNVMSYDDWAAIKDKIRFEWARDSYFTEVKDNEVLTGRLNILELIAPYAGMYYSHDWIRRNVLKQTDEMIEKIDEDIARESTDQRWASPTLSGQQETPPELDSQQPQDELDQDYEEEEPQATGRLKSSDLSRLVASRA